MNRLTRCAIFILLFSCNRKPFVEHTLSLKERGECTQVEPTFRLTSNFGGERFEFQKCLPASYDQKSLSTSRSGDTVIVRFNAGTGTGAMKLHEVTLDIDSYPAYHFINIDDQTFPLR